MSFVIVDHAGWTQFITTTDLTNFACFSIWFYFSVTSASYQCCLSLFASTFRPTMPGYELSPVDRSVIDKKNLCPKCEGLLREAVQTIACGHRYCKTCVETILW